MWAGFERIRDDSLGRVHTYVLQGWQPRGVRILDSKLEATGTTSRFAGMTKVDAAGGLELKPETWGLLRASTAGTVESIGHDGVPPSGDLRPSTRLRAFSHRNSSQEMGSIQETETVTASHSGAVQRSVCS